MSEAPTVLFVCEKWSECDPSHGPSNEHHNYIGSFRSAGAGACATFFFDEHAWRTKERCDAALLATCRSVRPDLIVVTPVRGSDLHPRPETLARVRAETGVRAVMVNGDTCDEAGVAWCESFAPAVDAVVVVDCYSFYPSRVREPAKYLPLWTPQDPTLFYRDDGARSIGISFLGSVARYPDRKRALGLLAASGIDVAHGGGQAETPLGIADYAAILRRSRITLNFARPVFEAPLFQCKGRTVEATMSGALLFEQANPETDRWLTPGVHYVAFDDERDLLDKVRHYLTHEDERAALAAAGSQHAERTLSAAAFWRRVLNAVIPARMPA